MCPLEGLNDEPLLALLGHGHDHDAPTGARLACILQYLGNVGVSNSSKVKHMKIPSIASSL